MVSNKAKQLGLTEFYVHMGMFDFALYCIVGDYESALKYVAWKFEDEALNPDEATRGYVPRGQCLFRVGYTPVIWIPSVPGTPREHATLAHESIHAVMHLLDWAAIPVTTDTEEVLTHATAHVVNSILEQAEKLERSKKKPRSGRKASDAR